jgi:hypothetical protein
MLPSLLQASPIRDTVLRNMNEQFKKFVVPNVSAIELKIPAKSADGTQTHQVTVSASAGTDGKIACRLTGSPEAAGQKVPQVTLSDEELKILNTANRLVYVLREIDDEVGRFEIPVELCVPFYRSAFRSFVEVKYDWWMSHHPLSVFHCFFSPEYHDKIRSVAGELVQTSPVVEACFAHVIATAASRLCYDVNPGMDLRMQQIRAADCLENASGLVCGMPLMTRPGSGGSSYGF